VCDIRSPPASQSCAPAWRVITDYLSNSADKAKSSSRSTMAPFSKPRSHSSEKGSWSRHHAHLARATFTTPASPPSPPEAVF
jgi:hypothetical protein